MPAWNAVKGVWNPPDGAPKVWKVGDCHVTRIMEYEATGGQEFILPTASKEKAKSVKWLQPHFCDERGRMKFAVQLMVVDAPGGVRIAVDTCVGNHKKRDAPQWHMRTSNFLENLTRVGIDLDSVTHVFCTHLHVDHIGWNTRLVEGKWQPTFPKAEYLFAKKEFEYWSSGGQAGDAKKFGVVDSADSMDAIKQSMADSVQPIIDAGLSRLVDFDHVIVDASGTRIYLRPTLGHSPGHCSLMIESAGERAIITGDCIHHPIQLTEVDMASLADTDSAQATETRRALCQEFCGTSALIFGTHFARPTCGTVVAGDDKNWKLDTAASYEKESKPARL
eukprot:TRINITY_DN17407_c0_g1_i1.p1 TRINITY_DN17407_c0_g1~~TRINITY_DN17407_c0_g1_i1.p1  ORF type:complete len:335 (-),score=86.89 TRINITY_DN17407_c0_g1_i1:210-1214(-)